MSKFSDPNGIWARYKAVNSVPDELQEKLNLMWAQRRKKHRNIMKPKNRKTPDKACPSLHSKPSSAAASEAACQQLGQ